MNTEKAGDDRQSKVEGRVEATGKSPEPGGIPACPTAQKVTEPAHRQLVAVLEQFNISLVAFEGLRCDSYEKHLARRSLAELEAFYETLLKPGVGYDRIREGCPPWQGGEHNGKLPTPKTLRDIKNRILAEGAVDKLEANDQFLKVVQARLTGVPAERQAAVYNAILELLGNELISATLEGKPLLDNLKGVDRIMKAKAMATRAEQGERRLKIREGGLRIREQRLADDRQRMQKTVEGQKGANISHRDTEAQSGEGGTEGEDPQQNEAEGEDFGMTESEKTDCLMKKVFGFNPYEHEMDKPNN